MAYYTWNELYERALNSGCGSKELIAKDNARAELENLIKVQTGKDINMCEIPEEEIDNYLENSSEELFFSESGNLVGRITKDVPLTNEEKGLIDGVELSLDYGLKVPEEDLIAYEMAIKKRSILERETGEEER